MSISRAKCLIEFAKLIHTYLCVCVCIYVGKYSVVSIATYYRLDSPMIESQWGRDFLHASVLALGPYQDIPGENTQDLVLPTLPL